MMQLPVSAWQVARNISGISFFHHLVPCQLKPGHIIISLSPAPFVSAILIRHQSHRTFRQKKGILMVHSQTCSSSRILGGILAVLALFFLYNTAWNLPQFDLGNREPIMTTIAGLKLSISHTPGSSPPEIVATVTNDNAFPVSILKYESPLDPLVLALGKLQITPAGADAPLDLPKIAVRRVWPPTRDQLVTLEPGESQQNPVPLREQVVPPGDLAGEVSIELKGRWQAVWSKRKEDIDDGSLENPNVSPEVEHGEYATGKLKVHF